MRRTRLCLAIIGIGWTGLGCPPASDVPNNDSDNAIDPSNPPVSGEWYRPAVGATWQWQLQPNQAGAINTSYDVDLYDIDLIESSADLIESLHAQGRRVICYFSAGTYEDFRPDAGEFVAAELGDPLDDFADERWLDIRSENVRRIVRERLELAVQKGCDCVEPDNVDAYANESGFPLTAQDQLDFNRFIANEARLRGLCVGLKNDLDQIPALVAYFDFAVNEQCHEFDECAALHAFIDASKPVFNAEYLEAYVNNPTRQAALCADAQQLGLHTLVLPLDLDDSFRFSCDPLTTARGLAPRRGQTGTSDFSEVPHGVGGKTQGQ